MFTLKECMKYFLMLILFSGGLTIVIATCKHGKTIERAIEDETSYYLTIGQCIASIQGISWSKYKTTGEFHRYFLITKPSTVAVKLPSGKILSFKVINSDFTRDGSFLGSVQLRLEKQETDIRRIFTALEEVILQHFPQYYDKWKLKIDSISASPPSLKAAPGEVLVGYESVEQFIKVRVGVEDHYQEINNPKWVIFIEIICEKEIEDCS